MCIYNKKVAEGGGPLSRMWAPGFAQYNQALHGQFVIRSILGPVWMTCSVPSASVRWIGWPKIFEL